MHIYLLEMPRSGNKPSSLYIGQRIYSPEESTNYYGSGTFCLNYRKKHDMEWIRNNVKKTILLRDLPNQDALNYWEKFAIADYRDRFGDRVVNWTKGGEGRPGPHTEEVKAKQSVISKKMWESEEHRTKMKAKMEKVRKSPEYKAKHSEACKKMWESDEHRAKMDKIYESSEHRTKLSKAIKKTWESDEFRAKMRKKMWGCNEFRAKMEKIWRSPEYKAKRSAAYKGENNPNFKINSVQQILGRIEAAEGVRIPSTTIRRILKNPKHKKHAEYVALFNKYKVEVE